MISTKITQTCQFCRKSFKVKPSEFNKYPTACCSRTCSAKLKASRWEDRFWAKVNKTETCWIWTGAQSPNGYGFFKHQNKMIKAHRLSYEKFVDSIPDGLLVCHSCDVRACVNPAHLFVGTQKENIADMISKGRQPNYRNPNKLTEKDVKEIRKLYAEGIYQRTIAQQFNICQVMVSRIVLRKVWAHIN